MGSLSEVFVKVETLETLLNTVKKKGEKGVKLTVSLFDKSNNDYNQNVTVYVSQTKEQVEAKAKKFYVANGNTYWSKGETPVFTRSKNNATPQQQVNSQVQSQVAGVDFSEDIGEALPF